MIKTRATAGGVVRKVVAKNSSQLASTLEGNNLKLVKVPTGIRTKNLSQTKRVLSTRRRPPKI